MSTWIIPDAPASPLSIFRDRGMRRFWLRSLLAPCVAMRWRDHALRLYGLHGTAIPNAAVLSKPLHGYLRRGLNPAERLRLLIDHYCLFSDLTGPGCLRAFCAGESVELALLAGRKGTQFRVFLVSSSVVQTQREGECAVCLQRVGNPMLLSRLSFTFFLDDGGVGLAIGGLQGPAPGHKRQVIEATRDLYGLRPKDAMLLAARSIAATFAMRVHAVSDTRHVHRPLPDDPKLSSYDRYWRERSAFAGEPLGFIFPPLREPSGAPSQREATKRIIAESVRRILDVRASR